MPPAARVGDQHACPSHVGGPVIRGSDTVRIGGQPAARVGDQSTCGGGRDTIVQGAPTVFIEGRPAARSGDRCAHSGVIVTGLATVIIGNDGGGGTDTRGGGAGSVDGAAAEANGKSTAMVSGTIVSSKVVTALVALARQIAGAGGGAESPGILQSLATALEVALARGDGAAVAMALGRLQQAMRPRDPETGGKGAAEAKAPAGPTLGWQTGPPAPGERPRIVAIRDGRLSINGTFTGLHAISELDLIEQQAAGRLESVVQRVLVASAAGRNCARVLCMYRNQHGELLPWATPGYWTAADAVIKRLAAYGMLAEFVLFADCEARPDGSGAAMPAWSDRRAFAREAGQFLKGRPAIVCGTLAQPSAGASAAGDPRLLEAMQEFRDASGGSVPFAVADLAWARGDDVSAIEILQRAYAEIGASIAALHGRDAPQTAPRDRHWTDRLAFEQDAPAPPKGLYAYWGRSLEFGVVAGRESDAEAAVASAALCAVAQRGFCYHHDGARDPAVPGLELARVATLIPQSPDFVPSTAGDPGSPITRFERSAFDGPIRCCANGTEAWAVGYSRQLQRSPLVEWRNFTAETIWRGDRVILWRGRAAN